MHESNGAWSLKDITEHLGNARISLVFAATSQNTSFASPRVGRSRVVPEGKCWLHPRESRRES